MMTRFYTSATNINELTGYFETRVCEVCTRTECLNVNHEHPKAAYFIEYIRDNYNDDISLSQVAKHFYLSPGYFGKILRDTTSMSYTEYVTALRIYKAKELLLSSKKNISQISDEIGYKDPNYFTKVFKKYTALTPKEFKKKFLEN